MRGQEGVDDDGSHEFIRLVYVTNFSEVVVFDLFPVNGEVDGCHVVCVWLRFVRRRAGEGKNNSSLMSHVGPG